VIVCIYIQVLHIIYTTQWEIISRIIVILKKSEPWSDLQWSYLNAQNRNDRQIKRLILFIFFVLLFATTTMPAVYSDFASWQIFKLTFCYNALTLEGYVDNIIYTINNYYSLPYCPRTQQRSSLHIVLVVKYIHIGFHSHSIMYQGNEMTVIPIVLIQCTTYCIWNEWPFLSNEKLTVDELHRIQKINIYVQ